MTNLTARGRALLGVGVVGAGTGWGLAQPAVVTASLLIGLLPLLGLLVVRRSRFVLGSARTVTSTRLPFGDEAEVVLTVENGSRWPSGALLLEDAVPESLGEPTRLVLDRVPPRAQRAVRYAISGRQRGRAQLGPLTVTVTDPFGTARVERAFTATTPVVVTPQVIPLGPPGDRLSTGSRGDATHHAMASRGDDDLLPREHRPGDDMRRIHWRATARQGELMVRREEQAWHSAITLILDDRAQAHDGRTGARSSFEWAVSAIASIGVHYLRQGWRVTIVTTSGHVMAEARGGTADEVDLVLQSLAEARLIDTPMSPSLGVDTDAVTALVAVVGRLSDESARTLARPVAGFAGCLLLESARAEHLRSQGWRVVQWSPGSPIADAWSSLAPSFAGASR